MSAPAIMRLPNGSHMRLVHVGHDYSSFVDVTLAQLEALTFAEETDRPGFREVIDNLHWDEMR